MPSKMVRATAAFATAGALAAGVISTAPIAGADTVIPLKDAVKTAKIGDGSITVTVKGQRAKLSPGMVALPTTRNAWVSGSVTAKIDGKDPSGGSIEAGYLVGCQIDVGDASLDLGASADSGVGFDSEGEDGPLSVTPSVAGTTGGSIKLAAGALGTQALTYDNAKWPTPGDDIEPDWASPSTSYDFDGASGSFTYSDQTIGVDGCAGYAQARLYVKVEAEVGNSSGGVILWGDRFTLG